MSRFAFFVFVCALAASSYATAKDTPPVPPRKDVSLEKLQTKLKDQSAHKEQLEEKFEGIEKELDKIRGRLVKSAKQIQQNEAELQRLEARIAEQEHRKQGITQQLDEDRRSIAKLVLALQRIERTPPEALIVKPGAPLQTAQTAMVMQDIIPTLHRQAAALKANIQALDDITRDLEDKKSKVTKATTELKSQHRKLAGLIDQRQQLYQSVHKDLKAQEQYVQQISLQAKSLQDLMARLDKERVNSAVPTPNLKPRLRSSRSSGSAQLPLSGIIRVAYDELDNLGAPSKGMTIEGRAGSLVVAPMDGIVRFAGHFKKYGNIVIIEHPKGYHSLIAGLEKIDTVVGHNLSTGEPLGTLSPAHQADEKPTLYYELRYDGAPVNPSVKFTDLG